MIESPSATPLLPRALVIATSVLSLVACVGEVTVVSAGAGGAGDDFTGSGNWGSGAGPGQGDGAGLGGASPAEVGLAIAIEYSQLSDANASDSTLLVILNEGHVLSCQDPYWWMWLEDVQSLHFDLPPALLQAGISLELPSYAGWYDEGSQGGLVDTGVVSITTVHGAGFELFVSELTGPASHLNGPHTVSWCP